MHDLWSRDKSQLTSCAAERTWIVTTDPWGIDKTYQDAAGEMQEVSDEAMAAIRDAMGRPPRGTRSWLDEPVKVIQRGRSFRLPAAAEIRYEDGTSRQLRDRLPDDLPIGYHDLVFFSGSGVSRRPGASVQLIVSPGRCHLPPNLRIWGWSAQVYAARSRESWGMGDLADLRRLGQWARKLGAGMVLINPLHATAPVLPQEPSPYSPSSRRYLNPLYLRIEELPEASRLDKQVQRLAALGRALNEERKIDRERVFQLKHEALRLLWSSFKGDPGFDRFLSVEGPSLRQFALFCALAEQHGAAWEDWPSPYRRHDSSETERFADEHADQVRYHEWLQWLLNQQLARAAQPLPLMQDLPVGFSPEGADAWVWQDLVATDMRIGAPPDLHSAEGQNWGLPPFIPHRLRAAKYEPFIQTIRAVLRHAGALRIDHVMGLFRLWWVPEGRPPRDGAYVRYSVDEFLAILAIESERAGAVIVGEDLGTVEEGVRETLAEHNVLSYRLLWFEDAPPSDYPAKALAAVTTHDLPTLAGIWTGQDAETQRRFGLEPDESTSEKFRQKLLETSGLDPSADVTLAITKTLERLAEAPCAIVMASMEAACAAVERPNLPSGSGKYPNWSLSLPLTLEALESAELPRRLAEIMSRRNRAQPTPRRKASHVR
jgi:4-alpha-glucanotransferase